MLGENFWQFLTLLIVVLLPPTAFVLAGYEDAAGGYGLIMLLALFLYGLWKILDDL